MAATRGGGRRRPSGHRAGPVRRLRGAIDGDFAAASDQDLYRLCLEGGGTLLGHDRRRHGARHAALPLRRGRPAAYYGNDDSDGACQSTLPAGHALTPGGGHVPLAVTPYDRDPRARRAIFGGGGVLAPVGPGGLEPLVGWDGRDGLPGNYRIALTGTAGCAPPDATAPAVELHARRRGTGPARQPRWPWTSAARTRAARGSRRASAACPTTRRSTPHVLGPAHADGHGARQRGQRDGRDPHRPRRRRDAAPVIDLRGAARRRRLPARAGGGRRLWMHATTRWPPAPETCRTASRSTPIPSARTRSPSRPRTPYGNDSSSTARYRVIYDFRGFLWPVRDRPDVNRARAGRPALVRFSLNGFHGRHVLAAGYPQVAEIECGSGAEPVSGERARVRRVQLGARLRVRVEDAPLVGRELPPAARRAGRRDRASRRLPLHALATRARLPGR